MNRRICLVCATVAVILSAAGASALDRPAAAKLWVPLTLTDRIGVARTDEPVTGGVPLPEGLVEDPARLAILAPDGNPVPAQFTAASRWSPANSVKWVLLDFLATVAANGSATYYLTDAARNPAPKNPIAVAADKDSATLTNGLLKVVIKRNRFNLFDEVFFDESGEGKYDGATCVVKPDTASIALFHGGASLPTYKTFSPANDPDCILEVEESGPMRAVVKVTGKHISNDQMAGGDHLLDFVCRIHAYANSGLVKVVYTMSCRQGRSISDGVPLDRAWLSVPLVLDTDSRRWAVGLPNAKAILPGDLADKVLPPWRKDLTELPGENVKKFYEAGLEDCWIVADSSDRIQYHGSFFRKREPLVARGKSDKAGAASAGWLDLADKDKGVAVGIKWLWQTWPRAVKTDPAGVIVMLHANFESRPPLMSGNHGPRANWYPGMSQTSTSMFYFHAKRDAAKIAATYAGINKPLFPAAPPSWYCEQTQAFGRLASSTKDLYDDETLKIVQSYDANVRKTLDRILAFRDYSYGHYDHYGMFNFGDVIDFLNGQFSDPGDINVTWDNGYYDFPHAMLLQFVRTGDLDFLETGVEAEQHVGDMDMVCWHPDERMTGANRYCDGTMHIRQQKGMYVSDTFNHYKTGCHFERFYLTGDRRSRDTGLLSAGFAMKVNGMGWGEPRSLGHGPLGVLAAYDATGDIAYFKRMREFEQQIANAALAPRNPARVAKGRHWQSGIGLEGMRVYYERTADPRTYEALKVLTEDCHQKKDYAESTLHAFAFLGAQLDKPEYTSVARKRIGSVAQGIVKRPWGYGQSFGNELRNAPYVFWYLTKDLPKKLEPKKMDFGS